MPMTKDEDETPDVYGKSPIEEAAERLEAMQNAEPVKPDHDISGLAAHEYLLGPDEIAEDLMEPMDLTETLMEGREEALVRSLFKEIRRTTPDEEEREHLNPMPMFVEDPDELDPAAMSPDFDAMEIREKYPAGGCHRMDAEGQPLSIDLLYDAMDMVHREGYDPVHGWEFWLHHEQLHNLQHREESRWWDTPDLDEEYDAQVEGVPIRALPVFPPGAVLLIDPSGLDPVHGVGSAAAQGVTLREPGKVCRITSIARRE